jgi:hypothetical protein
MARIASSGEGKGGQVRRFACSSLAGEEGLAIFSLAYVKTLFLAEIAGFKLLIFFFFFFW